MTLRDLVPGQRFRIPFTERAGTLLMVNDCRARVRYDGAESRTVHAGTPDERTFDAPGKPVDITPHCEVEPL